MSMYQPSHSMSGYFLPYAAGDIEELAIGGLDDVGLGHDGYARLSCPLGVVECRLDDALGARGRDDAEVDGEVVGDIDALTADGVEVLGVLAEEGPVDVFGRDANGPDVGEEVERLPHADVRRLDVGPAVALFRGVRGALDGDVAFLDRFEHVVGDRLHLGGAVLDGESLDVAELDLAVRDLVTEEIFEHTPGLLADGRADAVAADHADDDRSDG